MAPWIIGYITVRYCKVQYGTVRDVKKARICFYIGRVENDGSDGSMAPNQRITTNIQRNHVKCGAILNFNMARDGSRMAPMAPG
jgi:hypothetical protein